MSFAPKLGLAWGITMLYLGVLLVLPLSLLMLQSLHISNQDIYSLLTSKRTLHAIGLTIGTAFIASCVNVVFGCIVAWVQARYAYKGKAIVEAIIDLPFALPTSVAGIALTAGFSPHGPLGTLLATCNLPVVFEPLGIVIAMVFVGLPFVIRAVTPALMALDPHLEEAGLSLGASKWQVVIKVIVPMIWPSVLSGFAMTFARVLGEYGSIIFISGNMPLKTELVSVLIMSRLEEYDLASACLLASVMLVLTFAILLGIHQLQRRQRIT